jgi:hypothetical protein
MASALSLPFFKQQQQPELISTNAVHGIAESRRTYLSFWGAGQRV